MVRARFVVARIPAAGELLALPAAEAAHARARRLRAGDSVSLFDGTGVEAEAEIRSVKRGSIEVEVLGIVEAAAPAAGPSVWLGVCAVRPERVAWIAEKAGELAVTTLALVRSERTQGFRAAPTSLERLERLVRQAAKQSGSARWPACEGPLDLARALADAPGAARLFVDFGGEPFPARLAVSSAAILVGPEGGWSDAEREAAHRSDWRGVALPAATLRSETAAVAAVVLARAAMEREPGGRRGGF